MTHGLHDYFHPGPILKAPHYIHVLNEAPMPHSMPSQSLPKKQQRVLQTTKEIKVTQVFTLSIVSIARGMLNYEGTAKLHQKPPSSETSFIIPLLHTAAAPENFPWHLVSPPALPNAASWAPFPSLILLDSALHYLDQQPLSCFLLFCTS